MKKEFLKQKDFDINRSDISGASSEVKQQHLTDKIDAFNELAKKAEALGMKEHVHRIQNNTATYGRKLNRLKEDQGKALEPTPEPVKRVFMPGIAEKINIEA